MKKVINPCQCEVWNGKMERAFVEIVFEKGNLSLHGVIGPRVGGNCFGAAGQCVNEIRDGVPIEGWTAEMLKDLCDIWDEWHLNDMKPYCEHQKEMGWKELARKQVEFYHYSLNSEAMKQKEMAKQAALNALREGKTFTPSAEQTKFAIMPYSLDSYKEISGEMALYYQPKKSLYSDDKEFKEFKALGWLKQSEHPDGILCKPCPVCGYQYGTKWLREEVPQHIIDWLFNLPSAKVKPAWI